MAKDLLVIDDDANLRHTLTYALRQEGYAVSTAEDGEGGIESFKRQRPDLVVLDLMLPRIDGYEVVRRIRKESDVPILMLTARGSELDKVVGLEIGADDYLAKPFSMRELVARVRAMLRRSAVRPEPAASAGHFAAEGLTLDVGTRRVTRDGTPVELTPKEFDLLAHLIGRPGQVLTRDQLLGAVWGFDFTGRSRTVDAHVKTLRTKLGDDAEHPRWIETLRGVGYRFRDRH